MTDPFEPKSDPVDDFARGPEMRFGHENDRVEIRKDGEPLLDLTEILSVLKPFAGTAEGQKVEGWDTGEEYKIFVNMNALRRARDLYLKLGGVL